MNRRDLLIWQKFYSHDKTIIPRLVRKVRVNSRTKILLSQQSRIFASLCYKNCKVFDGKCHHNTEYLQLICRTFFACH